MLNTFTRLFRIRLKAFSNLFEVKTELKSTLTRLFSNLKISDNSKFNVMLG